MGIEITFPQLLLLLVIVAFILEARRRSGRSRQGPWSDLDAELRARMPVYSAETTGGKEAEFIRDRLPRRFPTSVIVLLVVLGGIAWWLAR
jgi:hypothetical protein